MTDDARAILSAIVADPADDTLRLAFADCAEEEGNTARAEFIRLQITAERMHPDSNARTVLEAQAEALIAEHWLKWWAEVCEAVGLPTPAPAPTGLGRVARLVGLRTPAGHPYKLSGVEVVSRVGRPIDGWSTATFRRGFPDVVTVSAPVANYGLVRATLGQWVEASPLGSLTVRGLAFLLAGPHLAGVRELTLHDADPDGIRATLELPHLARLEELTLRSEEYVDAEGAIVQEFANQVAEAVALLRTRPLKRLTLQVWSDRVAEAVANAPHLASLEALDVDILPEVSNNFEGGTWRLATLSRSPHLAGLKELTVSGWPARGWPAAPLARIACSPATWPELRKLTINADLGAADLDPHPAALLEGSTFPALEELRIRGIYLNREAIDHLIRSPLLKQLKHLYFSAWGVDGVSGADLRRMPEMFDLDRIETFRFGADHDIPELDELKRQLGDRVRFDAER